MSLEFVMYAVFMFSVVAYAVLDGFDLGVGCLHLFTKGDNERRVMINAIGPLWDGNATWIVIGGGVLFSAVPRVFSFLGPYFYTPIMVMMTPKREANVALASLMTPALQPAHRARDRFLPRCCSSGVQAGVRAHGMTR